MDPELLKGYYAVYETLLTLLEDVEDIEEIRHLRDADEEVISWEQAKVELCAGH